jgi:hypothetical protein
MNRMKTLKVCALALVATASLTTIVSTSASAHGGPGRIMGGHLEYGHGPVRGGHFDGRYRFGFDRYHWRDSRWRFGYRLGYPVSFAAPVCPAGYFLNHWGHCLPI